MKSPCLIFLIPTYQPTFQLPLVIAKISKFPHSKIVIVNDGSTNSNSLEILLTISNDEAIIINGLENKGKGAALKIGFSYIQEYYPGCVGVVTLDSDGQHDAEDVFRLSIDFLKNPTYLYLGTRFFNKECPVRSVVGNLLTRLIFRLITGKDLKDTQTGLRAIPMTVIEELKDIRVNNYDFEMAALVKILRIKIPIVQFPIKTIYHNNNKESHFQSVKDSFLILKILLTN